VILTSPQVGSIVEANSIAPTTTNYKRGKQEWGMWGPTLLFAMVEEFLPGCDPNPLDVTLGTVLADAHPSAQMDQHPCRRNCDGVCADTFLYRNHEQNKCTGPPPKKKVNYMLKSNTLLFKKKYQKVPKKHATR
jgi:hypothetical protein